MEDDYDEVSSLPLEAFRFPENLQTVAEGFQNMSHHYPGLRLIIGAIDFAHAKIKGPRGIEHSEAYRNRKRCFLINVQAIDGPEKLESVRKVSLVSMTDGSVPHVVATIQSPSGSNNMFLNIMIESSFDSGNDSYIWV